MCLDLICGPQAERLPSRRFRSRPLGRCSLAGALVAALRTDAFDRGFTALVVPWRVTSWPWIAFWRALSLLSWRAPWTFRLICLGRRLLGGLCRLLGRCLLSPPCRTGPHTHSFLNSGSFSAGRCRCAPDYNCFELRARWNAGTDVGHLYYLAGTRAAGHRCAATLFGTH